MIPESFETIMSRNNTTLPAAQNATGSDERDMRAAAATGKSHRKNTVMIVALSLALCLCLLSTADAASINKRAVRSAATAAAANSATTSNANASANTNTKTCHANSPCGWAIYIPFSRRIDYFMKNSCECSENMACLKTDDDLSVNAYVYRCKPRPASTTTDVMPTTDDHVHEHNIDE